MEPSDCIGCDSYCSYDPEIHLCFAILTNTEIKNIESCACATCLIKMMCGEVCEDFEKYRRV